MSTTTQIIHSIPIDSLTGAISVPIYQTSTLVQEAPGVNKGFDYARTNNPTRQALEKIIAELEGGTFAAAFASGLSAIDAVWLKPGGIKSLVCHPANMTHKSIHAKKRRAIGVSDNLIRLSIGLEEAEDLIADLSQAFYHLESNQIFVTNKSYDHR